MKINTKTKKPMSVENEFIRTVCSCLLWEDTFYESGKSITERIAEYIPKLKTNFLYEWCVKLRSEFNLRHIPLYIARLLAKDNKHKACVDSLLFEIIQRPDELSEFLAIYWKDKKQPLSSKVKKGLAKAFTKFNEYSLAKYNQDNAIKLRDVLFLCHAKPVDEKQDALWKKLINNTLETPETWETIVKKNTHEEWSYLLDKKRLGGLAFLRNLRNMRNAGITKKEIDTYAAQLDFSKVLPFRFLAARNICPDLEDVLEKYMFSSLKESNKFLGNTLILVDVSGSMDATLSNKSDLTRLDAACAVAMMTRELCELCDVKTFSSMLADVLPRRGFALAEAIKTSQRHLSTKLKKSFNQVKKTDYNRIIIITDEQSDDGPPSNPLPEQEGYIINIASYQNGVSYGDWTSISGFSENVLRFIQEIENINFKEN